MNIIVSIPFVILTKQIWADQKEKKFQSSKFHKNFIQQIYYTIYSSKKKIKTMLSASMDEKRNNWFSKNAPTMIANSFFPPIITTVRVQSCHNLIYPFLLSLFLWYFCMLLVPCIYDWKMSMHKLLKGIVLQNNSNSKELLPISNLYVQFIS